MGFGSKCSILNGQVIYVEKSKLNIADMWLIPLDHVTYYTYYRCHTFTMLKPRCVHDSSSLGKGIKCLMKLLGGFSYEKILRYNNLPLYATARWLPQQIPPLNFLAWSIVDIKNLQRAQKLHGFQSQVGLVHYVKITPIYLFPVQVLMLAITHPLWRIRSPIRGNTAMMRQSAIKYHHIQTLLMSTSCSTKRKVRINELDAGYRLVFGKFEFEPIY